MIDVDMIVSKIKTLLGVDDTIQDEALSIIVTNVGKHLLIRLKRVDKDIEVVPEELDFVVEEISIRRYNLLGSEGMKSESVEGHSINFLDIQDYFIPYEGIIDDYREPNYSSGRGKVMFI